MISISEIMNFPTNMLIKIFDKIINRPKIETPKPSVKVIEEIKGPVKKINKIEKIENVNIQTGSTINNGFKGKIIKHNPYFMGYVDMRDTMGGYGTSMRNTSPRKTKV